MKTNLLMLLFNRVGRGTYWRALGFAEELVRQHNYDVTLLVVAPNRKRGFVERRINGVFVVETPDLMPASGYDPWDMVARISWLQKRAPSQRPFDLIHAFESRPVVWGPAFYLQKRHHLPLIMDWCDWFGRGGSVEERRQTLSTRMLRPIETFFEERFRHWADGTTVINQPLAQKATFLGVPPERILLLPNGANVTDMRPQEKQSLRQRLQLPLDTPILGYTGAIFRRDAHLMAATFDAIQAQRPDVRLLIVGYCNVNIKAMVRTPTAVIQTGPVNYTQLADYVAACDIGWLPLSNSGANRGRFPMKVNDFMAAGIPLLVTEVGDLGKLVRQHKIGRVSVDMPAEQAAVAVGMLQETAVLTQMGSRARHIAETMFAWPVVTKRLATFYQKILTAIISSK